MNMPVFGTEASLTEPEALPCRRQLDNWGRYTGGSVAGGRPRPYLSRTSFIVLPASTAGNSAVRPRVLAYPVFPELYNTPIMLVISSSPAVPKVRHSKFKGGF